MRVSGGSSQGGGAAGGIVVVEAGSGVAGDSGGFGSSASLHVKILPKASLCILVYDECQRAPIVSKFLRSVLLKNILIILPLSFGYLVAQDCRECFQ